MITSLNLDMKKADQADSPLSITKSGKYVGAIIQAEIHETKNGANFLGLTFKDPSAGMAFLSICLQKADGNESKSIGIVHAMMHILGLQKIQTVKGKFRNRFGDIEDGYRVPDLEKRQIGFLLQRVNDIYENQNHEIKQKYELMVVSAFDAVSGKTSHEIQGNKEAQAIAQRLEKLTDRNTQKLEDYLASGGGFESPNQKQPQQAPAVDSLDSMDEDIPF